MFLSDKKLPKLATIFLIMLCVCLISCACSTLPDNKFDTPTSDNEQQTETDDSSSIPAMDEITDPGEVSEPGEPTESDEATEPEEPTVPETVNEPDEPTVPETVTEPEEPTVPETVIEPEEVTEPDVATEPEETVTPEPTVYYVNTNTKKIHMKWCSSVADIAQKNLSTTTNPDSLLNNGYKWCKRCH